jgi:hypothetical protein
VIFDVEKQRYEVNGEHIQGEKDEIPHQVQDGLVSKPPYDFPSDSLTQVNLRDCIILNSGSANNFHEDIIQVPWVNSGN